MRTAILVGMAIVVLAPQGAVAEDLPKAPFSWTGLYIGANAGVGGDAIGLAFSATGTTLQDRASGAIGGGQLGYNFQLPSNVVIGFETDLQRSDIKVAHHLGQVSPVPGVSSRHDDEIGFDWFGTARLRLGYVHGRLLPFVTGGLVYGHADVDANRGGVLKGVASGMQAGWTVGAGAEYAVSDNLSAKLEYDYLQLPGISADTTVNLPAPTPSTFATSDLNAHTFRIGLNWHPEGLGDPAPKRNLPGAVPAAGMRSGWYAGVNGGYGAGVVDSVTAFSFPIPVTTTANDRSGGFIGGGQAGFIHRAPGGLVLGIESDLQWSEVKARHQVRNGPEGTAITDIQAGMTWFGTTRLRVGQAFGSDLLYVTGGLAYGEVGFEGLNIDTTTTLSGAKSETKFGWTAGGGLEHWVTDTVSLKGEYLFTRLDGVSGIASGRVVPPDLQFSGTTTIGNLDTHIVRFGMNYNFN